MTESPLPPADRRRSRKISNGRPGYIVSAQNHGREGEDCPGLAARVAAASILNDIVGRYHPLDECFSGTAILSRLGGLEPRDIALTRSIVTVALRRLGTIRAALAGLLEKGLPRQATHLEWTLIAAAAQILLSRGARSRRRRSRCPRDPPRGEKRALCFSHQWRLAQSDSRPRKNTSGKRPAGARHARMACGALAQNLWRGASARDRKRPSRGADTRSHGSVGPFDLGGAAWCDHIAHRFAAAFNSYASDRTRRLRGRPLVCPGCGGGSAGEAFTGWTGDKSRRFLRGSRRQSSATRGGRSRGHRDRSFGRAFEKARLQFRKNSICMPTLLSPIS